MTYNWRWRRKSMLLFAPFVFALCNPSSAEEPISVGLLQGWYMVEGGDPDGSLRARMFGEYQSNGRITAGRNVFTYVCKKGWRDYLRVNIAPEVEHMIATVKQDPNFRFSDTVTFVGKSGESKWIAWYDAEADSVSIEFPDNSEELIKRRYDLILLLNDDFSVSFGPIKSSPIPFQYMSSEETQSTIRKLEEAFSKKLELQDRAQFLNYCIQIQF